MGAKRNMCLLIMPLLTFNANMVGGVKRYLIGTRKMVNYAWAN